MEHSISEEDITHLLELHDIPADDLRPDLAEDITETLTDSLETAPQDSKMNRVFGLLQTLREYLEAIQFTSFSKESRYINLPHIPSIEIDRYMRENQRQSRPRASRILSNEQQEMVTEEIHNIVGSLQTELKDVEPLDEAVDDPHIIWYQSINILCLIILNRLDNGKFNKVGGLHSYTPVFTEKPSDVTDLRETVVRLTSKFDNSIEYNFKEHYDDTEIETKYIESMSFLQGILRDPVLS